MENRQPQITFNITGGTQNNVGSQISEQHNTFTGNDMKTQSVKASAGNAGDGQSDMSSLLSTPEARELWQRAQQAGWVDEERQPTRMLETKVSKALFANIMANRLGIPSPMYEPFEKLWGEEDLSRSYSAGNAANKNQRLMDDIKASLK